MRATPSLWLGVFLVPTVGEFALGAFASSFGERCADLCAVLVSDVAVRPSCQEVCDGLEAREGEPCIQALTNSTDEHLTLLSYSSGDYMETARILTGAAREQSPEYLKFIRDLLLNGRGSPAACDLVDNAHYCLLQASSAISLGLCLPDACDSASISNLLANVSSISSNPAYTMARRYGSRVGISPPQGVLGGVVCGDESSLDVDAGTVLSLLFVGCLIAATVAGALLDRRQQPRRDTIAQKPPQRSDHAPMESNRQELLLPTNTTHGACAGAERDLGRSIDDVERSIIRVPSSDPGEGNDSVTRQHGGFEEPQVAGATRNDERISALQHRADRALRLDKDTLREPLLGTSNLPPAGLTRSSALTLPPSTEGERERGSPWWIECLKCFSVPKNLRKLLAPPPSSNPFNSFDGLRALMNMWVILLHVATQALDSGGGLTNASKIYAHDGHGLFASLPAQVYVGGLFAVDVFFMMSAFLASVMLLSGLESGCQNIFSWVLGRYWHRYIRLMPVTGFVTLVTWQLYPLVSDGPAWWPHASALKEVCRKYWWTEITFIQNIVPWPPGPSNCIPPAWSLGVEMQFFLAAVPLIALYHYRPRASVITQLVLMVGSCFYTLWRGFARDIRFPIVHSSISDRDWFIVYTSPVSRCSVYIIGMLCGMAWHTHIRGRVASSSQQRQEARAIGTRFVARYKYFVPIAMTTSALLTLLPVFGAYWADRDQQEVQIPAWADHFYLAFSRPAFALGVATLCGLCIFGLTDGVNSFLSLSIWPPLSRLTFCCYLTHLLLIQWLYSARSVPFRYTSFELTLSFIGVVGMAFPLAAVVHLLVEAPFRNIESWVRKRRGRKRTPQ